MSIIPAGKTRLQVNQGGLKNESIFESELFKRFAATGTSLQPDQPDIADPSAVDGSANDLNAAMGQGANPSMRNDMADESNSSQQASNNPELDDPSLNDRSNWKVNPITGDPIGHKNFVNFYQRIQTQKASWEKEVGPLNVQIKGDETNWQITIQPQGKVTPAGR